MAQMQKNRIKKKPAARKRAAGKKKSFLGWLKGLIKRKKKTHKKATKRKGDIRKIYKTTDGFFTQNPNIKKQRRVAAISQRDDGAVAVVKIYKKEGKDPKNPRFVQDFTLTPKKHKSLDQDSLVDANVHIGRSQKIDGKKKYSPIMPYELSPTKDRLTKKEYQTIMEGLGGGVEQHKKTNKDKLKNWKNHFGAK